MMISERTVWTMPKTAAVILSDEYMNRFAVREYDAIGSFVERLSSRIGGLMRYDYYIAERLDALQEIRYEYGADLHKASSKNQLGYIVFFQELSDEDLFQITFHHELFHFIQPDNSIFETYPPGYEQMFAFRDDIDPLLFEEAFVQYLAAAINGFPDERSFMDSVGEQHIYWLSDSYCQIVGYISQLHEVFSLTQMMHMYLDDDCYEASVVKYDQVCGIGAFGELFEAICLLR